MIWCALFSNGICSHKSLALSFVFCFLRRLNHEDQEDYASFKLVGSILGRRVKFFPRKITTIFLCVQSNFTQECCIVFLDFISKFGLLQYGITKNINLVNLLVNNHF